MRYDCQKSEWNESDESPSFILPLDVRAKQRLLFGGSSETLACVLPVFAHVISSVRLLAFEFIVADNFNYELSRLHHN